MIQTDSYFNPCPNPSCGRTKPRNKALCLPCWRLLPDDIQDRVFASYREGGGKVDPVFLSALGERLAAGTGDWPEP